MSTIPPESGPLRAGNQDRERIVAQLNAAFAEGRLDVGELDERVAAAYAAKTLGELVPLTADLPADLPAPSQPHGRPAPRPAATPAPRRQPDSHLAPVAGALGLFLVNVLIWAAVSVGKGDAVYFWPVWTAIPLVFAVVGVVGRRRS